MDQGPLVSIVLPTHNGARFLEQSVESCLSQTHSALELVLVDDASMDRTPELIARYQASDPRVRSVRHSKNRGLANSLNTGLAMAQGELLTWTSDDNAYRPQALERMIESLRAAPQAGIVYAGYLEMDETGAPLRPVPPRPLGELSSGNCIGACFLFRREVYTRVGGYDPQFDLAEDYEFWLRASLQVQFIALEEDLYLYRVHPGSLTASKAQAINRATDRALRQHLAALPWAGRTGRASGYVSLARLAAKRQEPLVAARWLSRAVLSSPRVVAAEATRRLLGRFAPGLLPSA